MIDVFAGNSPITTGFIPRKLQADLREKMRRFNVVVCHRRFGKTVFAVNHQIDKVIGCHLPAPRAAYIAPTFGQAKRVSWDYYKHYTKNIPQITTHEQDLRIDYGHNGGRQLLLSTENYVSIKGIYLDDAVLDEYAEMDPAAWTEAVRPTLSDRNGGSTFIGTPKGRNNFYKLYEYATQSGDPEWYGCMYKASETGLIAPAELASAQRTMSEEEYAQEYECSFEAGLVGAYFSKELAKAENQGRVGKFPYDPLCKVDTYWDLGINDMTAIWFIQTKRGQHYAIDYYEISGLAISDIMTDLKRKPYDYGTFVFPHDVTARDMSTGRSQQQIFAQHGARPSRVVPRIGTKREGINAARMMMATTSFDREKCKRGLECLANYQRRWDAKNNVFQESPLHNWASNGADAFQQFALGQRGDSRYSNDDGREDVFSQAQAITVYDVFGRGGR